MRPFMSAAALTALAEHLSLAAYRQTAARADGNAAASTVTWDASGTKTANACHHDNEAACVKLTARSLHRLAGTCSTMRYGLATAARMHKAAAMHDCLGKPHWRDADGVHLWVSKQTLCGQQVWTKMRIWW